MLLHNPTGDVIRFSMDGMPGDPPTVYEVPPGGSLEMRDDYVASGAIAALAPGLTTEAPERPTKEMKPLAREEAVPPGVPLPEPEPETEPGPGARRGRHK